MTDQDLVFKVSFEDLLALIDQLTPEQRLIVRQHLDQPFIIPEENARRLYELFAPVREEALQKNMTEEEINAIIDQAIKEVRKRE